MKQHVGRSAVLITLAAAALWGGCNTFGSLEAADTVADGAEVDGDVSGEDVTVSGDVDAVDDADMADVSPPDLEPHDSDVLVRTFGATTCILEPVDGAEPESDARIGCWGEHQTGSAAVAVPFVDISAWVALPDGHCLLDTNGTLSCFDGALAGTGTLTGVRAVAGAPGSGLVCAIDAAQDVVCGTIDTLAETPDRYSPGDAHSLGVVGDVVCWLGSGNELACGRSNDDYFLGGGPFVQLSANEFAFVAVESSRRVAIAPLQADGEVTEFVQLAGLVIPTDTFELVGSGAGWCAFDDEDAHCWIGDNSRGQLGLGTRDNDAVAGVTDLGGAGGYRDVVFGLAHGCGVDGDEVWCWGSNHRGQVLPSEASAAFEPVRFEFMNENVVDVAAAPHATCVIVGEGGAAELLCAGVIDEAAGVEQPDGSEWTPLRAPALVGDPKRVAIYDDYICVATVGDTGDDLFCGALSGPEGGAIEAQLIQVAGIADTADIVALEVGGSHVCVETTLSAGCWSRSDLTRSLELIQVQGMTGPILFTLESFALTEANGCAAITPDGMGPRFVCWGPSGNDVVATYVGPMDGMMPAPTNVSPNMANPIDGLPMMPTITEVLGGPSGLCFDLNGSLRCQGDTIPAQSLMGTPVALGGTHVCANDNGTVRCAGDDTYGQLGDGDATGGVPLSGSLHATAAGAEHTCVAIGTGLHCWGSNSRGAFGAPPGIGVDFDAPVLFE